MQISKVNSNQSFGASKNNNEAFEFTNLLDSTGKRTSQLADLFIAANSAISSPEEATIRILNNQIDGVVNDKKTPKWVKKPVTYISATLITAATYLAATKGLKTPGVAIRFLKSKLANNKVGQSVLNFGSNIKESAIKVAKALKLKDNKYFNKFSKFVSDKTVSARSYLTKKFPKISKQVKKAVKFVKLDKWSKKDYYRNIFAGYIGFSAGKRHLKKHSEQNEPKTEPIQDLEISVAA